MQMISTRDSVLSLDLLEAIRSSREACDTGLHSEDALRACESTGARLADAVQRQLTACGMGRPVDWLRHRALVIGYVSGSVEGSGSTRWAAALSGLTALSSLMGSQWDEAALCVEEQRLRMNGNPGYLCGLKAAREDVLANRAGKTPTALALAIIDREMQFK